MTTTEFRAAWHAVVDGIALTVERREVARADALSPRARTRNGYRETPGTRVEWHVVLVDPDPVLGGIIETEAPASHDTRKAAESAIGACREVIRNTYRYEHDLAGDDLTGSRIPSLLAAARISA